MKISNDINIYQNFINKSLAKNGQKNTITNAQCQRASICNPKLYQAYNNITFGKNSEEQLMQSFFMLSDENGNPEKITSRIILPSGETMSLILKKDIINGFLTSKEGQLDEKILQKFLSTYQAILQDITNKEEAENEFLSAIVNGENKSPKKSNISYLNPNDEAVKSILSSLSVPEEDFVYSFFNGIKNEQLRKSYSAHLLAETNNDPQIKYDKALNRTIRLFDICRNPNGYDFSNLDSKIKFVIKLEDIQTNYGGTENEHLSEDIIDYSKDDNGHFDMDFAQALSELVRNTQTFIPEKLVSRRVSILKIFTAMEEANAKQITDTIVQLSSIIDINDSDNSFEAVMVQAFNPVTGKFDETAANLLLELTPLVIEAAEDIPLETEEDFEYYKKTQQDIINGYFEQVRDAETGDIKKDLITPEKYIKSAAEF